MERTYWLEFPNGARQKIDPRRFDLGTLEARAAGLGGRLRVECDGVETRQGSGTAQSPNFDPPISALAPLFRSRFERIYQCRVAYHLDVNARATTRVLGGYYRKTRLVRVYARDRATGRRPLEEVFDTFLHEMAHHLEYTEPDAFQATFSARVRGRMHSALFWRILSFLKRRWSEIQFDGQPLAPAAQFQSPREKIWQGESRPARGGEAP